MDLVTPCLKDLLPPCLKAVLPPFLKDLLPPFLNLFIIKVHVQVCIILVSVFITNLYSSSSNLIVGSCLAYIRCMLT